MSSFLYFMKQSQHSFDFLTFRCSWKKSTCTSELKKDMRSKRTWDLTGQNETDVERFFKFIVSSAL